METPKYLCEYLCDTHIFPNFVNDYNNMMKYV
jgi:hypothetical protein|nr:MAG TPA: hypothetical protein [Caudoviricetes sp.]